MTQAKGPFRNMGRTFCRLLEKRDEGSISTKHGGTGLGNETVQGTAERNHGTATLDYGDGMFQASAMLRLDDEQPAWMPVANGRGTSRMAFVG